jgi:hypothetical protein
MGRFETHSDVIYKEVESPAALKNVILEGHNSFTPEICAHIARYH